MSQGPKLPTWFRPDRHSSRDSEMWSQGAAEHSSRLSRAPRR